MIRKIKGQTMILTVLLLSGAILSATAISALLVLFQLRQVTDIKTSTQAIFAADAGIECVLFELTTALVAANESGEDFIIDGGTVEDTCSGELEDNNATYRVVSEVGSNFKSVGRAGRTARALEIGF